MSEDTWEKQVEDHRRALEAARTSVARHGFVFNSVLGSSDRIRELYNGNKKVRVKRVKRRSSLPSILTPLSPVQFLPAKLRAKKFAPSTRYLPTSKGSIGARGTIVSSRKKYDSSSHLNPPVFKSEPIIGNMQPSVPELPVVAVKVDQSSEKDGNFALVTPQSIFSNEEESVDKLHDKLLLERMQEDQQNGLLLGASRSSTEVMQHPNVVKQHKILEKM